MFNPTLMRAVKLSPLFSTLLLGCAGLTALTPGVALAQTDAAPFTSEQIEGGRKLFAQNCAVCHGQKMVDPGGGFFDLRTFPPQQRSRFMNSVGNGKNNMPPWRSVLSADQIGQLFAYVVAGEPK